MIRQTTDNPNQPSHLKDLVLLFAIPIGIAVFTAIAVYAPRLFVNPRYDFIYSVCGNYSCGYDFNVDSAGYISPDVTTRDYYDGIATLRYYSTKDDSTRSLTLQEAKRYQLNTSSKSPDGYSLKSEESNSGFLFWGNYDSGWYLKNGSKKKKVELSTGSSYNSREVKFLGWVTK